MIVTVIFDLHADTLLKTDGKSIKDTDGHINLKKLILGGVKHQCFAVFPEDEYFYQNDGSYIYYKKALKNFIFVKDTLQDYGIFAHLTVEDSELLNGDITRVKVLKDDGVILASLLWNRENCLGFPHISPLKHLKQFGFEAVDAFYQNDILVDVSHLNYTGFFDIANNFKKPIIASHSACFSLCRHTRNLTDKQLKAIGNSGGIAGIPFYAPFLREKSTYSTVDDILLHIQKAVNTAGVQSVGLGSDFDGFCCDSEIKDASYLKILAQKIIDRFGYETADKILYKNALRVFNL